MNTKVHGLAAALTITAHQRKLLERPGDCGIDLYPSIVSPDSIRWKALGFYSMMMIPTETTVLIPEGHFGWVVGRSSSYDRLLGCSVISGIIDHGYTGEYLIRVQVPLNSSNWEYSRRPGGSTTQLEANVYECSMSKVALAQVIIIPFVKAELEESYDLPLTRRGKHGYGSTDAFVLPRKEEGQ